MCLGCEQMGVFIYKKLFQHTLQEAHLISYQPHFSCSWFCSQCTVLPFRRSFWMNVMTMHIYSRTLLSSPAKINPKTLFTFCNNQGVNWQWLIWEVVLTVLYSSSLFMCDLFIQFLFMEVDIMSECYGWYRDSDSITRRKCYTAQPFGCE